MSFLGGAECSTAGNPLTQFTKHVQDDKSLQRDRLRGGHGGMQEGMRSSVGRPGQDQVCLEKLVTVHLVFSPCRLCMFLLLVFLSVS